STFDIFGTLSAGAELHLVPPEFNLLPPKLAQFIREARLTQWFSVPSVLNMMAKFDVVIPGDIELRHHIEDRRYREPLREPGFAMVLGTVGPQNDGEVRCRDPGRLSRSAPGAVVRRSDTDAHPDLLDAPAAARALHQPVRPHRGDDREQLLH